MKKIVSFLVIFVLSTVAALPIFADTAAVTGKVQLNAKSSGFPANLIEIFMGHDTTLPKGKKGKKIDIKATYIGETKLRISELGEFEDSASRYMFDIPVPTVMQTFTNEKQKATKKFGVVQVIFASLTGLSGGDGDTDSVGDGFGSNSIIKVLNISQGNRKRAKTSASSLGQAISISKVVAVRKGNKGTLKGTFANAGKKAKGRFALKFVFTE